MLPSILSGVGVITHPLASTCFWRQISRLGQYRTATTLKVIVGEMPVVRRVAKPFWLSLLERYWPETERRPNGLGSAFRLKIPTFIYVADLTQLFAPTRGWVITSNVRPC